MILVYSSCLCYLLHGLRIPHPTFLPRKATNLTLNHNPTHNTEILDKYMAVWNESGTNI